MSMKYTSSNAQKIAELLDQKQITAYGFTQLEKPLTMAHYYTYLEKGFQAGMKYLEEQSPLKENPEKLLKRAKSAIVFRKNYFPHPHPREIFKSPEVQIARYAQGEDYHFWLKKEMDQIIQDLKQHYPDEDFVAFTDSSPVLERDLAYRAGLGWVGKNSCLIHPKEGSLFFLAEIYTTLDLEHQENPIPDRCGTCTRCIDLCPTKAITEDRTVDSNLCISYWTIEAKSAPPENLRSEISSWYFGCDICQTVCPWNQKAFGKEAFAQSETTNPSSHLEAELEEILKSSNRQLLSRFSGTSLSRATPFGHRRNAILLAVKYNLKSLSGEISRLGAEFEKLRELSDWALSKIN